MPLALKTWPPWLQVCPLLGGQTGQAGPASWQKARKWSWADAAEFGEHYRTRCRKSNARGKKGFPWGSGDASHLCALRPEAPWHHLLKYPLGWELAAYHTGPLNLGTETLIILDLRARNLHLLISLGKWLSSLWTVYNCCEASEVGRELDIMNMKLNHTNLWRNEQILTQQLRWLFHSALKTNHRTLELEGSGALEWVPYFTGRETKCLRESLLIWIVSLPQPPLSISRTEDEREKPVPLCPHPQCQPKVGQLPWNINMNDSLETHSGSSPGWQNSVPIHQITASLHLSGSTWF